MPAACEKCNSFNVTADDGKLTCAKCFADRGTLSALTRDFIAATIKRFGPLDAPVVLRAKLKPVRKTSASASAWELLRTLD